MGDRPNAVIGLPATGLSRKSTFAALLNAALDQPQLVKGRLRCRQARHLDAVLAWGRKPSARCAERLATRRQIPLWRLEDAFVRSLGPAPDPPLGLVVDQSGTYYDAGQPSDLDRLIATPHTTNQQQRAETLAQLWCQQRLSKYNGAPEVAPPLEPYVLVVDQTAGDLSIRLGGGSSSSFQAMLSAALKRHPHSRVLVKTHPEVALGRKHGHFTAEHLRDERVQLEASGGHPTALLEQAEAVYVVTSQLGFEALLWGKPVFCFGMPFYAGWGLTHDILAPPAHRAASAPRQLSDLVHAALIDYAVYIDPHSHQPCAVEDLVRAIGLQRQRLMESPAQAVAVGFERWKRPVLRRFLPGTSVQSRQCPRRGATLVRWGRRGEALSARWPGPVLQVEDGFLRSVGLGGDLNRPISWVVDQQGIYYDATRPSDLETWLATAEPTAEQLERAAGLRRRLVDAAITKYNLGAPPWQRPPGLKRVVLVAGQVERDASIRYGAPGLRTNLDLLQAVRRAEPDAFLIYKPHPDVVAGLRQGSAAEHRALEIADRVLRDAAMEQLFTQVDAVHVLTSLTGFEALLRGLDVHTWGLPFYAGWGLTHDAHCCPRRGRHLSLDALVVGALIVYPRYVSRRSGWQITPEQAIEELVAWREEADPRLGWTTQLVRLWARLRRRS